MFTATVPPVDYRDPWNEPLEDRVQALMRRATHRVAYLYEHPDTSTFRYRVYNMVQALEGDADIAAAWFTRQEIPRLLALLDRCDALVLCRTRYCERVAHLLTCARSRGVATIFDCDDLVFDPDYVHLVLHTLDQGLFAQAWDHWFAMIGRLNATLRLCDRAIVTNEFLAGRVRACAPGKDVGVVPNFLNRTQMALSLRLYDAKRRSGFARDGRIHVGYFSGTPTHAADFAIAVDALAELLRAEPRAVLRLVGFLELPPALAKFADRIERFPLQDFLNLQRLIGAVEFNLVPLQFNDFTNSKSELKYFEAAIAGTVTFASPSHAFRAAIHDGENGYLVPSYDWLGALQAAIDALGSYPAMAERAFAHARATYAPEGMAPAIRAALFAPGAPAAPHRIAASSAQLMSGPATPG